MQRAPGALNAAARTLALWRGQQQQVAASWQQLWHRNLQCHQQQHHYNLHQQPFSTSSAAAASGVSMPSPSRLDQLVKLGSLLDKSPEEVQDIWMQYHAAEAPGNAGRIAGVQTAQEYATFRERAKVSPLFVMPLKKEGSGYLTLLLQVQLPFVLFTTLEEYRAKGSAAPPHLTLVHYAELEAAKGLVLVRGDVISDMLISVPEARTLMELVRAFYIDPAAYKLVHTFNHEPAKFDFNELLRQLEPKSTA